MITYRLASECAGFPYGWPRLVCYFTIDPDVEITQIHTRDEQRAAVRRALNDEVAIFAVWPGRYRSDLFRIDKPELLAEAIKLDG